jgi:hypothetical protein
MRAFGFYFAYLLVPVSTVLLSVPLVPFTSLLPTLDLRIAAVAVVNVSFLVATAASHRMWSRAVRADTRRP